MYNLYTDCIADIKDIRGLVKGGRSLDAQRRLKDVKAKWEEHILQNKGTEVGRVIEEALCRLPKENSRPDKWLSDLADAEGDFAFHLDHQRKTCVP